MNKYTRDILIQRLKEYNLFDNDSKAFYLLNHEEKSNPEVFETFCKSHGGYQAIVLSDDQICDNKELVTIAKKYDYRFAYHLLSQRLLNDPEMALLLADCMVHEYNKIGKELRDDPELMLKAVKINPYIYRYLTSKVKTDIRIVLEIVNNAPNELRYLLKVGKKQRKPISENKNIALIVAEKDPKLLFEVFSENILSDKDILNICFSINDKVEFKKKLYENTWAIKYIEPNLWKDDLKIIQKALKNDGSLFEILPEEFKHNKRLALIAIKKFPDALEYCSEELYDDEEIIKAALQEDSEDILSYASDRLRSNYDIVYKAVKVDGLNLQYASEVLQDNKEIVLQAIKDYGGALYYASERLKNDPELIKLSERNM